jgi:hypothetical protein
MRFTRLRVGLILLLCYAALSDARWAYRAARGVGASRQEDSISRYERRFRGLERTLPARGVIGYTSGGAADSFTTEDFKRFLLTEYALAPRIVVNDTTPDWVVGNFTPDSVPSRPPPGFEIVQQGEAGVRLLRRTR